MTRIRIPITHIKPLPQGLPEVRFVPGQPPRSIPSHGHRHDHNAPSNNTQYGINRQRAHQVKRVARITRTTVITTIIIIDWAGEEIVRGVIGVMREGGAAVGYGKVFVLGGGEEEGGVEGSVEEGGGAGGGGEVGAGEG